MASVAQRRAASDFIMIQGRSDFRDAELGGDPEV